MCSFHTLSLSIFTSSHPNSIQQSCDADTYSLDRTPDRKFQMRSMQLSNYVYRKFDAHPNICDGLTGTCSPFACSSHSEVPFDVHMTAYAVTNIMICMWHVYECANINVNLCCWKPRKPDTYWLLTETRIYVNNANADTFLHNHIHAYPYGKDWLNGNMIMHWHA